MEPEETIDERVRSVLDAVGDEAVQWLQIELMDPYPGPSRPGESPHKRTGTLYEGCAYRIEGDGPALKLVVEASAPYAAALEYGTDRMAARPFMRPVFDRLAPEFQERMQSAFPR